MWDDHRSLRAIANLLIGLALLAAFYGAVLVVVRLPSFPLREVRIAGALAQVTREQVEIIVKRELGGNFFTVDLEQARRAFEKLPWVRQASVRRQWPDRLEVTLEEQVALARWGTRALVNTHGEVFDAAWDRELPVFIGPAGTAQEVARQYAAFTRALGPIRQPVAQLSLSPRRAWQVKLANGMVIELGRSQMQDRLERFVAVHDRTLGRLARRIDYVDLRYPNGFAVRLPGVDLKKLDPAQPGKRKAA
ncbi:MAG: cell division protein FtsQ/DivIB [Betaproteobacteria bacterium]|nr:cell division protein FtsQ/DivIB [Betaproteobacteria bacterium]